MFESLEKPLDKTNAPNLSQIINWQGKSLVKFNQDDMRGFNKEELVRIIRVGLCLNCHPGSDRIFKKWKRGLSCPKFAELNLNP